MPLQEATLEQLPFKALVLRSERLRALRERLAGASPAERRAAAPEALERGRAANIARALGAAPTQGQAPPRERAAQDLWRPEVEALAIDPEHPHALLAVGSLEMELGRRDAALELLMRLAGAPPDAIGWAWAIDEAGAYLADHGELQAALDLYRAGLSAAPESAALRCGFAACLLGAERVEEAIEQARSAVALAPEDAHALELLGHALAVAGRPEQAREVLKRAVVCAGPYHTSPAARLQRLTAE